MIEAIKAHSPLRAELQSAGLHLERDRGLCPFHPDKHPSLTVKGERWKCWSCGDGGDVIDFTAKYHGIDTKAAIKLLAARAGISTRQTPAEAMVALRTKREREQKHELVQAFRHWEQERVDYISADLRAYKHMMATRTNFTEAELIDLARLQGEIDYLEYIYEEILCKGYDEPKFRLYQEAMTNAGSQL